MRKYLFLILIVFSFINCRQNVKKPNSIEFGQIDSLYSDILVEFRKIWVYIPESFSAKDENTKYPVLYLLDGDSHYFSVSGLIRQLSSVNRNTNLPEMIVVAIPNTNRNRDLTPTHVDINFFTGDSISYDTGGGDKFLDFIEKELAPFIEKNYPANSYRTFVGHSFGGLSVINAFIRKPYLFENYIAIDPSLWWDNMIFKNAADSILNSDNYSGKALFVAVANTMENGMDIQKVQSDTSIYTAHIRSILQFVHSVENITTKKLDFKWKFYSEDDHGSVPLIAEYDGLRWIFGWYKLKELDQTIVSAPELTSEELINPIISHYEIISSRYKTKVFPPETMINQIGYYLLREKMPEKAATFFDLNIKNYPNYSNVYDSRGDCYLAENDSLKALEFFKKALNLEDLEIYRDKIKELEKNLKK